jgi:hypothetical protein
MPSPSPSTKSNSIDEFTFREYLKLSLDSMHEKLQVIDSKTEKTDASLQGVIRTINQMELINATHHQTCPNTKAITVLEKQVVQNMVDINTKLSEYAFFKKYWKVFLFAAILSGIGLIYGVEGFLTRLDTIISKKTNNELPKDKLPTSNNTSASSYIIH